MPTPTPAEKQKLFRMKEPGNLPGSTRIKYIDAKKAEDALRSRRALEGQRKRRYDDIQGIRDNLIEAILEATKAERIQNMKDQHRAMKDFQKHSGTKNKDLRKKTRG